MKHGGRERKTKTHMHMHSSMAYSRQNKSLKGNQHLSSTTSIGYMLFSLIVSF